MIKLTKGLVNFEEAVKLAPDYVAFHTGGKTGWNNYLHKVVLAFEKLKKGQVVLAFHEGQFVKAKVSSIKPGFEGEPIVRVSNGEYSWRVDGCDYAVPI